MTSFTCPTCATTAELVAGEDGTTVNPSSEITRCDSCKTLLAYGTPMPRIVIEPATDDRFVVMKVGDAIFVLEKTFAKAVGHNLTSIT